MSKSLLIAGALSLATCLAHAFGGGPEFHEPVLASNASDHVKAGMSVVWHAVTAFLFINGVALFMVATQWQITAKAIVSIVAAQYAAFLVLFIAYGSIRLGSPFALPQWIVFALMILFSLMGIGFFQKRTPT